MWRRRKVSRESGARGGCDFRAVNVICKNKSYLHPNHRHLLSSEAESHFPQKWRNISTIDEMSTVLLLGNLTEFLGQCLFVSQMLKLVIMALSLDWRVE